jgi:large subunit ribosomal protein L21
MSPLSWHESREWNCKRKASTNASYVSAESLCGEGKGEQQKMFAVIKSGGRQYKVSVGETLEVNRLPVEDGEQVRLEEVLLISDEDGAMIGAPLVDNAVVLATAVRQARGKKLIVFRYKSKKRFRHKRGHRQELTVLSIDDIVAGGKSLITGKPPKAEETPAEDEITSSPPSDESGTPVSEASDTEAEKKTTRRRRAAKVEDTESTESNAEEE